MFQLLRGIAKVHSKRLIHRDIKPQNILLKGDVLKLGDFGLARSLTEPTRPYTVEVSTMWYRAPEVMLQGGNYSTEVDVWSAACVFFEMITSRPLFPGDSEIDQIHRIFQHLGTPSREEWPQLYQMHQTAKLSRLQVFPKQSIFQHYPDLNLDPNGYDLLDVSSLLS